MSEFTIFSMPGGEVVIGRILREKEDGVEDYVTFMLRKHEQKIVFDYLRKHGDGSCSPEASPIEIGRKVQTHGDLGGNDD